ncbi:hypothetical protein J0B03_01475 [Alkalibacter rhizosphaerae]|uniref:Uncharacterized protein n=1 Tax=Alkalibacter rhizosphaerae TaxID=2815577 RepID=A0A974XFA1_9FIRM|nr:hypothetical protein [Alkalibacter rhizosphaerae]QSX08789.1 hypothetical protein J0B03_01475 [Alkalibacter rhizosphaerae]
MEMQEVIIWALILFGAAMIVIGIMDYTKKMKDENPEFDNPRIKQLQMNQSLVDAASGVLYVLLGYMGISSRLDLQLVYALVFGFAIIKKIIDTMIKSKVNRLIDEE